MCNKLNWTPPACLAETQLLCEEVLVLTVNGLVLYGRISLASAVLWCYLSFFHVHHSFRVGAVWPSPSSHCCYGERLHRPVCRGGIAGHRFSVSRLASSSGRGHLASAPAAFLLVVSHVTICGVCCSNVLALRAVYYFTVYSTVENCLSRWF